MIFDEFVDKRWNDLLEAALLLHLKVDSDAVHRLRVAVKKLRTMSRVVDAADSLKPLRELYKACGLVREPEIMIGLLKAHTINTDSEEVNAYQHLGQLRTKSARALRRFLKHDQKELITSSRERFLEQGNTFTKSAVSKNISKLIVKHKSEACSLREDITTTATLHTIRKHLKHVHYLLLVDEQHSKKLIKKRSTLVHETESFLGSLHDKIILRDWISSSDDLMQPSAKRKLRKSLKQIISEDQLVAKTVLKSLCQKW